LPESRKFVVDEQYLKHIRNEVKSLKEAEPKDRLECQFWLLACAGLILQHTQSSLAVVPSSNAVISGLLQNVSEEDMKELFEGYRKLAIHLLKVDEKLTKTIPTSTPEAQKSQDQIKVDLPTRNPLVQ
jgi:hypothetical protein